MRTFAHQSGRTYHQPLRLDDARLARVAELRLFENRFASP
jgi:hypothetical protein